MKYNKYQMIIDHILDLIQKKKLRLNDKLPSITEISKQFNVARETSVKAYKYLIKRGVVEPVATKGFFVLSESIKDNLRVFVFFDVFKSYKEDIYNGIKDKFGKNVELDIYFHHFKSDMFNKIVSQSIGKYHYYIVMPWPDKNIETALSRLKQDNLLLLDRDYNFPGKSCCTLCQDFGIKLQELLTENWDLLEKYKSFTLVFPENRNHPNEIKEYFKTVCQKKGFKHNIIQKLQPESVKSGHVYLVIEDYDLVTLIQEVDKKGMRPGKDIGIISYNETHLKKIIKNGVTVISTDFYKMGKKAAEIVLKNKKVNMIHPTKLIYRNTL
jgi:DNA-binding transcriptional regulator YhcF (GntR family)